VKPTGEAIDDLDDDVFTKLYAERNIYLSR
jgi:hypothetical protein